MAMNLILSSLHQDKYSLQIKIHFKLKNFLNFLFKPLNENNSKLAKKINKSICLKVFILIIS